MQPSIQLKQSAVQDSLRDLSEAALAGYLQEVVLHNADAIGYMLQEYYPKEKVRKVEALAGSFKYENPGVVNLRLSFTLEEFNACSAVDTLDSKQMPVTIYIDYDAAAINLRGEYWPEA